MNFAEFDNKSAIKLQKHDKISTVAELFEISEDTVRKWLRCKKLKGHKLNGAVRIPHAELIHLVKDWTNYEL
jgi:excisionase family DNA binding protein